MPDNERKVEILDNLAADDSELKRETLTDLLNHPIDDEIISKIVECLANPDKGIRDAASFALMHNGDPGIPDFVVPLITSEDISVRNTAGEILLTIGEPAVDSLIPYVNCSNSDDQKFAIDILGLIGSNTASASIITCLRRSENDNVLLACFEALGNIKAKESLQDLILFYEKNELYKSTIIEAIGKIGSYDAQSFLINKYTLEDTFIKYSIIESLGLMGDESSFYFLLSQISGMDDVLRFPLVRTLYQLKDKHNLQLPYDEKIKDLILKTLHEGDIESQKAAVFLIDGFADKEIVFGLAEIYGKDPEIDLLLKDILTAHYQLIIKKISSLPYENVSNKKNLFYLVKEIFEIYKNRVKEKVGEIVINNLTDKLTRCLSDPDEETRILVFEILFAIDSQKALLFIDDVIKDENIWNRLKVLDILSGVYEQSVEHALKFLAHDEEEMIRSKAIWVLTERGITNTNNNNKISV